MAKSIKDLYNEKVWEIDFSPEPSFAFAEGFDAGANAVLSEIEQAIEDCHLYQSLYVAVLDRIKQLKGEDRA